MTWVAVGNVGDLSEESAKRVEIDGLPVCLVRSDGELFAIGDTCSHADVSLSEGEVEHGKVECWLHGSMFDLRTGKPCGLPATRPVPVYHVKTEGDTVLVSVDSPRNV